MHLTYTHTHTHLDEGLSLHFQACFRERGAGREALKGLTGMGALDCWEGLM